MSTFSERLRVEREKLGLTQEAFAEVAGVKKRSQVNYEKGDRQPDSAYLEAISKVGVDVSYLITGIETAPVPAELATDEQMLLEAYRALDVKQQKALLASLLAGQKPSKSTVKASVKGKNNSVKTVGGDLIGKM